MDKKTEIKKIWSETFGDSREFIDLLFSKVYSDDNAMTLTVDSQTVSSLLLIPYPFGYQGQTVEAGYIAGVATRREFRHRGYMRQLLGLALAGARERGMALAALIPASRTLYFLYDKLDFATVFYYAPHRFTALHNFELAADIVQSCTIADEQSSPDRLYNLFHELETQLLPAGIIHTPGHFEAVLADLAIDRGIFRVAVDAGGRPLAAAAAVEGSDGETVVVRELLSRSHDAAEYLLQSVREAFPGRPILVMAHPAPGQNIGLEPRGMVRITDPKPLFDAMASGNRSLKLAVRVTDTLIADNNHTYIIDNGQCQTAPSDHPQPLDLDVDITTLAKILFSDPATGDILALPTARPSMRLMLD